MTFDDWWKSSGLVGFELCPEAKIAKSAWEAAALSERERVAAWIEPQRNDIPATGAEFAAAIRAF